MTRTRQVARRRSIRQLRASDQIRSREAFSPDAGRSRNVPTSADRSDIHPMHEERSPPASSLHTKENDNPAAKRSQNSSEPAMRLTKVAKLLLEEPVNDDDSVDQQINSTTSTSTIHCKKCQKPFTLNGDSEPVLLFCGHSICSSCEVKLLERDRNGYPNDGAAQCPICLIGHRYRDDAGDYFSSSGQKTNYQMKECMEKIEMINNKFMGHICVSCGYPMAENRSLICLEIVDVKGEKDTILDPDELNKPLICGGCMMNEATHKGHGHASYLEKKINWKVDAMKKAVDNQVRSLHAIKEEHECIHATIDLKWDPLIEKLKAECDDLKKSNTWAECEAGAQKILDNIQRLVDLRNTIMTSIQGFCSDLQNVVDS